VKKTKPFRAGFFQFDIKRGGVRRNLGTVLGAIQKLAADKVRLTVLPEMWTSGFVAADVERLVDESEHAVQELRRAARRHRMVITGSSYERAGRDIFNTAFVIDADGEIVGSYRKIHLFSPGGEHLNFTEGKTPLVVQTEVGKLGMSICYDLRFPELYRALSEAGAEVVVVPAQWPVERLNHWQTLLRARAIENQIFLIGCNRTGTDKRTPTTTLKFPGASVILDPWGRELAAAGGRTGAHWAEVDLSQLAQVRKQIPVWVDRRPAAYKATPKSKLLV
jgi:predicted amidohydrolase